jgi:amidohydrolase
MKPISVPGLIKRAVLAGLLAHSGLASAQSLDAARLRLLDERVADLQSKMVAWRRDIHQHPELSGQEARTAKLVAEHLRKLGLDVRSGVGGHGVVGLLKGGLPGKVVALRADMDALPVQEVTGLPFASRVVAKNMGKDSPVMHACGHDGHTAILMGVAELLAGMRAQIPGSVKFIFQPAEEGRSEVPADPNDAFGARAMVEQGALDNPKVEAIFGLHIYPAVPVGTVAYRSGPLLASADSLRIKVTGRQTHGAFPWKGIDPIVVSAQIVTSLQAIVSRQLDITNEPAVLSIGAINGGNRENIIPDSVEMLGTLRTFDEAMRADAKKRITATAEAIGAASGAKAEVAFDVGGAGYAVTANAEALTEASLPVLRAATGGKVVVTPKLSGSEDFSEFQKVVPGFFFILGAPPKGKTTATAAPNHSPAFDFDEDALAVGAKTLSALALDFLARR